MPLINFSGLASGIDSNALIEAMLAQQRTARVDPFEKQISDLRATNTSFEDLATLVNTLEDSVQTFRTLNGGGVEKVAHSSDSTTVAATASSEAQAGTYNVTVNQLAKNATFSFDDRFLGTGAVLDSGINDVAPAADRTVSFDIGTGGGAETVNVVMTSTMTAGEFVTEFNNNSSKATASLVNTGTESSPSYAIVVNSESEGTTDGTITLNSVGIEIGIFATNTLDQAADANISIDGISGTISRSSNIINDVVDGLTLDLQSTGTSTITIGVDEEKTAEHVQNFVNAYNEIVSFLSDHNLIERDDTSRDNEVVFGPLASTRVDDNLLSSIREAFANSGTVGQNVNILADLGITTERDGTLKFDSGTFSEALSNPEEVKTILANLGESLGAVDGTLRKFTRFKGLFDTAVDGNQSVIESLQNRILQVEDQLGQQESSLTSRFARLESSISKMQSQQNALTGLLAGLQ
jgi:flagellar hook-associated protein 2